VTPSIPISGYPISSDGLYAELSTANPAIALRAHAGEICHLFMALPWDPVAQVEVPVFASTHGYQWGSAWPGVCDAWQTWPAVIESAGSWSSSLYQGGQWRSSSVTYGQITVLNLDGAVDAWKRLNWRGRWFRTWAAPWSLDAGYGGAAPHRFTIIRTGYVDDIQRDDQRIYVSLRDARRALELPINPHTYIGLNTALQFGTNAKIAVTDWAAINSNNLTFEMFFQNETAHNGTLMSYGWKDGGWRLVATSDGALLFEYPTDSLYLASDSGLIESNLPYRVSISFNKEVKIYLNGEVVAAYAGSISVPDIIIGSTPFQIGV
jgi:hypothetical protein